MNMRFINYSFAYWRRKNKVTMVRGVDPFSFSSEVQGIISDPSPFFTKLLINASRAKEIRNVKENPVVTRLGRWLVTCPYCGERFPYNKVSVLRCPKCNNVIEKVNFKEWNKRLDSFLNGEISEEELYSSQVVPETEGYRELRDNFLDPDIPKEPVKLPIASYGFDRIYKLYSPRQLLNAVKIIKEIRKSDDVNMVSLCTLSLLDYVTYNSLFSQVKDDKVYSIFTYKSIPDSWVETSVEGCYVVSKPVLKEELSNVIVTHPYTLSMSHYSALEEFYYHWAKRAVSYSDGYSLIPRFYKDLIYDCHDEQCTSFTEKPFTFNPPSYEGVNDAIFFLDKLDYDSLIYILSLKDFRVMSVERDSSLFKIHLRRGKQFGIGEVHEIHSRTVKENERTKRFIKALSISLNAYTSYEKIIGVKDLNELLRKYVFSTALSLIDTEKYKPEKISDIIYVINKH